MSNSFLLLMVSFGIGLGFPALGTMVYVPPNFQVSSAKMVVVVHGCLQSPESMAFGTGWNQVAEKNNLLIVYPQVPTGSHPLDCWGWYLPENQTAESGQLKGIVDQVRSVQKTFGLKNPKIFVTGMSSGGGMVSGLLACFPNMFSSGAVHSGPSYAVAQSLEEANKVLKYGPSNEPVNGPCSTKDFKGGVMVIQGEMDLIVNPRNALRVISDFTDTSVPSKQSHHWDSGTSYSVSDFEASRGAKGRLVTVKLLDHSWSGYLHTLKHSPILGPNGPFPTKIPFFSEIGPSATYLMWDFFAQTGNK